MISSLHLKKSRFSSPVLSYCIIQLWALLAINVSFILAKYIEINIMHQDILKKDFSFLTLFLQISLIFLIIYFKSFILIISNLIDVELERIVNIIFNLIIFLAIISLIINIIIPLEKFSKIIRFSQSIFGISLFVLEILILLAIPLFNFKLKNKKNKQVLKSFMILFLLKYIFILFLIVLYVTTDSPSFIEYFSYLILIFLYITPPYTWLLSNINHFSLNKTININNRILLELNSEFNLTSRELEIISLIMKGMGNKEIEDKLSISYSTVKNHLYNIYKKVGVTSRLELSTLINNKSVSSS